MQVSVAAISHAEDEAEILTTGIRKCEDHDQQEEGLQQQVAVTEQLSDNTILERGIRLGKGGGFDGTLAENDAEIVFETPEKLPSGDGGILSSSQAC
mmetsp:Transcript_39093/g.70061  ORF Transcript_39093/g.70061 Transcript_39093/m.70061 type:complete len:97 (+) Transcript_39093:421-711(+)